MISLSFFKVFGVMLTRRGKTSLSFLASLFWKKARKKHNKKKGSLIPSFGPPVLGKTEENARENKEILAGENINRERANREVQTVN